MSDATAGSVRVVNAPLFIATIGGIAALIVMFLSLDLFLAHIDQRESMSRAAAEYTSGVALLREGRAADARDHFQIAVSIERSNIDYSLALAEALLEEGRVTDAESTLQSLLQRAENDGAVNLTMARAMVRQGRAEEAKAYFHRAIFGRWGADSVPRRYEARFELIDFLAAQGASRELLAELLPMEDVPSDSLSLRRKLGGLFILAGSPARAANMFREVIRNDPDDGQAYAGMGRAELALGNFRTARADLAEAVRRLPDDSAVARRFALADTVLSLDPTARGIGSRARLDRSRALLLRVASRVESCGGPRAAVVDSAIALLARTSARSRRGPVDFDAEAEPILAAAADTWAGRPRGCASAASDEVLPLLITRITQ
jgi:predicted Zn-dependent protease